MNRIKLTFLAIALLATAIFYANSTRAVEANYNAATPVTLDTTLPANKIETPKDGWSFRNHVMPVLTKLGCNQGACHGC